MKISVVTPSCRKGGLDLIKKCLDWQEFRDFEWITCTPYPFYGSHVQVPEPVKKDGETYNLNKCWNAMFKKAQGELIVSIVDLLWFPPDVLDNLWAYYQIDKMSCIGGLGNQYERLEQEKPEGLVWSDPRFGFSDETYFKTQPLHFELCLASIPKKAILETLGMKEKWDHFAALSEKELCVRIEKLGYTFWFDKSLEYRAIQHPRLTKDWDERYQKGIQYFNECISDINKGKNLQGDLCLENTSEQKNIEKKLEKQLENTSVTLTIEGNT